MYKTRNTGTGNGMRGRRGMGTMLYSEKCHQTFRRMSQKIPGNVAKYSGKYRDKAMYKTRNTGTGNGMRGMLYSGECPQTFRGISSNIPGNVTKDSGNVAKYSGESRYKATYKTRNTGTGNGMSPIIPGNVLRHSGECHKTFRGMSPNIPRNIFKHSG